MSKDVITQFRWAGRMEKDAFKDLKNIQIVLLSAMVRVDRNYTLYQFENDIKSVLTKCITVFKKTNAVEATSTPNKTEVNDTAVADEHNNTGTIPVDNNESAE